jgi:ribosome-binding protein aMBF1 (putative translation factor)
MISVTFHKENGWCWGCGSLIKGYNAFTTINGVPLQFCQPCLEDLRQQIVQNCCDTEYMDK